MKQITGLAIIIVSSILVTNCTTQQSTKPKSSGKTGEIMVVTKSDRQWEGLIGDTLRYFFQKPIPGMPSEESWFSPGHVLKNSFSNSKMFKAHHNILIAETGPDKKASVELKKDLWSQPQTVIRITAPDDSTFIALLRKNYKNILEEFRTSARKRLAKTFSAFRDHSVIEKIRKKFHVKMIIPNGFTIAKNESGFMWIRKETQEESFGILIYRYDYRDTAAFSKERIISFRNAITKKYVPGPSEGSYMAIEQEYADVHTNEVNFNGKYAIETRGLWKVEGDFMGGPFLGYTLVDEERNKVLTFDGYVYAPGKDKRFFLMQLETMLRSAKFVK